MSDPGESRVLPVSTGDARTVIIALYPSGAQHRKLWKLADTTAKLWNELNYEYRQMFFNNEFSWDRAAELQQEYYNKYKTALKVNAGQVISKLNEAWKSFFKLLKKYNKGELPDWMNKPSPPGY